MSVVTKGRFFLQLTRVWINCYYDHYEKNIGVQGQLQHLSIESWFTLGQK